MSELANQQARLSNTDEVANLDVLRAVAVLSVFFGHLYNFTFPGYSETAWHFGQMGVLAFFVHTSLVLMYSLERQAQSRAPLFSTFYVRRAARIYPLAIAFVLIAFVTDLAPEGRSLFREWTWPELVANLTLATNLVRAPNMVGGLWTLPLEVQMYVVLPILFVLLRNRAWPWVVGLIAVSIPLAFVAILITDRLSVLTYVPCFLAGVMAWRLTRRYQPILPGWAWPIGLVAASLVWFQAPNLEPYHIYLRWAFCFCVGASIPMFRSMGENVLTRVAAVIAKYSYGIYLSHIMVMTVAFRLLPTDNPVYRWGVFLVLAVSVPYLAFHLIENPMIQVGKRFRGWPVWRRKSLPAAA